MSSTNSSSTVVTVDEQAFEHAADEADDVAGSQVVDETPDFRASVQQETQAKVDANHPKGIKPEPDGRIHGVTLEQEERIRAREAELELVSAQGLLGQDDRVERTREVVTEMCGRADPEPESYTDPRERLTQDELAAVNTHAIRISEKITGGYSRPVIAALLADRMSRGVPMADAVLGMLEQMKEGPGAIVPIADVPTVSKREVDVDGEIITLWTPTDSAIAQVGLIADETDKIKFTIWKKSNQPVVREGQTVRFRAAAKNWYEGRCSIALTGWSRIVFPERDNWWEE